MIVHFAEHGSVDVVDADCEFRPCFQFGLDKGTFVAGRGYTRYYDKPYPVCMTRHLHGCPHKENEYVCCCDDCGHRPVTESEPCPRCGGTETYKITVLLDPLPCCDNPQVGNRPQAYRQRCRSCGTWLKGTRLRMAREATIR